MRSNVFRNSYVTIYKGVGRKISIGAIEPKKEDRKIAKKTEKIALLSLFQGGERKKKTEK